MRTLSPLLACLLLVASSCVSAQPGGYIAEHQYDTTVHGDEALLNVNVAFNRWPDCSTLETTIHDMFRLEGVLDKSDQDKAFALWKWFRIMVSATGGGYVYERNSNWKRPVFDPHKIFAVYGHHQCDGLSWAMVPLWRAAGYMAFDMCHWGHTIASLRYKDHDGKYRFHNFDPQARHYHWDPKNKWVGTWNFPLMRWKVHRHVLAPLKVHSLRTSLRVGETVERNWTNTGHVIPPGRDKLKALEKRYYKYPFTGKHTIKQTAGEEVQTFVPPTNRDFDAALYEGSTNTAASDGVLHPAKARQTAAFVYRMAPPYVVADATIQASFNTKSARDVCRLLISHDGEKWEPVFTKAKPGFKKVLVDIGFGAWKNRKPNVYTDYTFFVKAELKAATAPTDASIERLEITARRVLNKRALPHLRPGENVVRVTADRLIKGQSLALSIDYTVNGKPLTAGRFIRTFPYYFKITVPDVPEQVEKNYDYHWNEGAVQMQSIRMKLSPPHPDPIVPTPVHPSLPEAEGAAAFKTASPHPADMTNRKIKKATETHVRQTSGFFPQAGPGTMKPDDRMKELLKHLNGGLPTRNLRAHWSACEDLGDYPAAVDDLLAALPKANIDTTLFICKALARNPHKKMIGPLLKKWRLLERGSPGTRYIPDVLAAIGDRSVVPELIKPLKKLRFDYRFHIAHALGKLGGPEAKKALTDLAKNDPLRANREFAQELLNK
jgi:HEAT repeat protein